jgi:signal transduction histidine kinase
MLRSRTATSGGLGADALERLDAVAAPRHELEVDGALDRRHQPVEVHGMVVGEEDAGRRHCSSWPRALLLPVAQELVVNAVKHAAPTAIDVAVERRERPADSRGQR